MGQLYATYLAPGYTVAQRRAAFLNLATQAWGAPTYRAPNVSGQAQYVYGAQHVEWPDFRGRKHVWSFTSSSGFQNNLAVAVTGSGATTQYRSLVTAASYNTDGSDTSIGVYLLFMVGEDYRGMSFVLASSGNPFSSVIGEFQAAAPWWGTKERVYVASDRYQVRTIPGISQGGAINANGDTTTYGRATFQGDAYNSSQTVNPFTSKRELRLHDHFIDTDYGVTGWYPDDHATYGALNIPTNKPAILDDGAGRKWISFNNFGTAQWAWKVDNEISLAGLTTYPVSVYDFGNPPEGVYTGTPTGPVECEPVWPEYGQRIPNPRALKMRQIPP